MNGRITVSAWAWSQESARLLAEGSMKASARRTVYRLDRHWVDSIGRLVTPQRREGPPAFDPPGEGIDHQPDVDEDP